MNTTDLAADLVLGVVVFVVHTEWHLCGAVRTLASRTSGKDAQLPNDSQNILVPAVEAHDHATEETELRYGF